MELTELNLKEGFAFFVLEDGDDWTEYQATFSSHIYYEDDSFSHAFGIERCGHWELDLENFTLTATDFGGKALPLDKDKACDVIYEQFDKHYKEQ